VRAGLGSSTQKALTALQSSVQQTIASVLPITACQLLLVRVARRFLESK
jgi:hypothetical protein